MSKLLHEITRQADVGIWANQSISARIYNDKIIVGQPYVKWANNSGNLAFRKIAIRDKKAVEAVLKDIADIVVGRAAGKIRAWDRIASAIDYLDFAA